MDAKQELECDVLIVGGGINGCSLAADAASRGLRVILCEQNDLGSATSSASSKLIHGGLRYLEQYNVSMVRKSLKERTLLFKLCPYLIKPLAFVLPHQKKMRPYWLIRLGLFFYDHLCKTGLPTTANIERNTNQSYFSFLKPNFNKGFLYYDACTIDSRLVVINAIQAQKKQAIILTRCKFISADRNEKNWLCILNRKNQPLHVQAKMLVNATGPWVDNLSKKININSPYHLSLVQGSHIVVNKLFDGDFAYILQNEDDRIVFAIPYHSEFTLIGTTDTLFDKSPDECQITNAEVDYLLEAVNAYFSKQLKKSDIKHTYCGIRPLIQSNTQNNAKDISRDYKIFKETTKAPYICIYGGKLTTYRVLAKECIDDWKDIFPNMKTCQTDTSKLPGANFKDLTTLSKNIISAFAQLPKELLEHYMSHYGSRTFELLKSSIDIVSLGQFFGGLLYQVEVDFLIENEWAQTVDDIIWRRTKQGLFMDKTEIERLQKYLDQQKI